EVAAKGCHGTAGGTAGCRPLWKACEIRRIPGKARAEAVRRGSSQRGCAVERRTAGRKVWRREQSGGLGGGPAARDAPCKGGEAGASARTPNWAPKPPMWWDFI